MFFVVSGLFIIFIFGLGYPVANFLCYKNNDSPLMEKIPFILTTGFLVNYLIVLLVQSLKLSLLLSLIISAGTLIWFVIQQGKELKFIHKKNRLQLAMILSLLLLYYFAILSDPLEWWDARSIWFFHAKMIWSAQSINLNAGWQNPWIPHADYPKLIPVLAAQVSHVLGHWNEYAPKLSLFLFLIPPVFWIFSFYSRSFSFLFLVLVLPFGLKSYLWNGSMDGYVAFYSAVSMLLLGRYFIHRRLIDLVSCISCLALVSNLKNEGMLIGLIGILAIAVIELSSGKFRLSELKKIFNIYRLSWLAVIISPCIIWSVVYKHTWGLTNDLKVGTAESFSRLIGRFADGGSFLLILKKTVFHDESAVGLALVTFIVSYTLLKVSKRYIISWMPALITAAVYYCGIVTIYLLTPADLNWHLATSIQRTMLTVTSCIIAGTYFILRELEDTSRVSP